MALPWLFTIMSLLTANALSTFVRINALEVESRQVVPKQKTTEFLVELLKNRGLALASARRQVHSAWQVASRDTSTGTAAAPSSWRDAFVSVHAVVQAGRALGLDVSLAAVLQPTAPIDVDALETEHEQDESLALVPLAGGAPSGSAAASSSASRPAAGPVMDPVVPMLDEDPEAAQADALGQQLTLPPRRQGRKVVAREAAKQQADLVAYQARQTELANMEHGRLVQLCMTQETSLKQKDARVHVLARSNKQLKRKLARADAGKARAVQKLQTSSQPNEFAIQKLGKQRTGRAARFSLRSKFSVGLRRSLTNIAASDFGIINMVDLSRQSVLRYELLTGAGIIRLMQIFVAEGLGLALEAASSAPAATDDSWSLFGVGFRCDATNAAIWRRQKLHVLEADVLYVSDFEKLRKGDFAAAVVCRHCVRLVR